jgi:hypothetical protein
MYEENEIILDDSNYVKTKFIHVKDEDKRIWNLLDQKY